MRGLRPALGIALLLLPGTLLAHSPIKGLDNFYAGLLHPVFVPSHLLSALALGIVFGQQGPATLRPAILGYLAAVLAGLAATGLLPGLPVETALLVGAAATGILIALDRRLPVAVYLLLAVALGLMIGVDSGQDALSGRARLAALLGTLIAAYLLAMYAMMLAEYGSRRDWTRIGLRVLGSWTAASALLVLSLSLAG
jgi:urease accessory protein